MSVESDPLHDGVGRWRAADGLPTEGEIASQIRALARRRIPCLYSLRYLPDFTGNRGTTSGIRARKRQSSTKTSNSAAHGPPNVWSVNQKRTPLFPRSPTEMFNVRQSDACVLSSPDRLSLCSRDETLVQLLASATATLDSDRHRAKACIERAAELLQVSRVREEHGRSRSAASRGGLAPWQVKRVAAYIEAHFDSNVRAAELARVVRLSTSHFCRAFRESFGESPIAYVTRRRMRHAQVIMLLCREPLSQIALHCGMCDQAHFTRVFRKIVGINPSVWRRQFLPGTRALTTPAAGDQSAAL
jgi:AraC family transcriptional regulator